MVRKDTEIISKKLDAVISILMNQTKIQEENSKEKIVRLIKLGLDNNDIANIVITTPGVVAKERSLLKKRLKNE